MFWLPLFSVIFMTGNVKSSIGRSRIVGGSIADRGQFPHQVWFLQNHVGRWCLSFDFKVSVQCRGSHFCGGSLLNPWMAITAAHCCDKITEGRCQQDDVQVVAGKHSLSTSEGTEQVNRFKVLSNAISSTLCVCVFKVRPVMDFVQHTGYKAPQFFNDICLIHFKEPLVKTKYVQFINLSSKTPYYGTDCQISGWGATSVSKHSKFS